MHLMEVPEGKGKESGRGRKACERVEYPSAMSTRSLSLSFVSVGVLKREWERANFPKRETSILRK